MSEKKLTSLIQTRTPVFSFRFPAVILLGSIIVGTVLGRFQTLPWPFIIAIFIGSLFCLAVAIWASSYRQYFVVPLCVLFICLAYANSVSRFRWLPSDNISHFANGVKPIQVFGRIDSWPVIKRQKTLIICAVDSIVCDDSSRFASGTVLITIGQETTAFAFGDEITFRTKIYTLRKKSNLGRFDYSAYLKNKGIQTQGYISNPALIYVSVQSDNIFGKAISHIREWILDCLQTNLTPVSTAMASGFLIGETHDIPPEIYLAFRRTGTMHLLAVSGSNVALVLLVLMYMLRMFPLKKYIRLAILLLVIIIFSNLSYNQPSVIRASVMAALVLIAGVVYRRPELNNIIAVSAGLLILYNPGNLFDIGFQLSFAVTWGLVLFVPIFNLFISEKRLATWQRYLLLILFCSVIASAISIPITAYYFGEFSLVTVFSNLLIVPLVSVAVVGIIILLIIALCYPPMAILPGIVLDRLLRLTNEIVLWFSHFPHATIHLPSFSPLYVFLWLIGIVLFFGAIRYMRFRRLAIFYILIVFLSLLGSNSFSGKEGDRIIILNNGTSHSVIFQVSDGLVVYNQNKMARHDSFLSGVFSFLTENGSFLPRYYAFFDVPYRITQRMDALADRFPDRVFYPVEMEGERKDVQLWELRNISFGNHSRMGSVPSLSFFEGGVLFEQDSCRVLYLDSPDQYFAGNQVCFPPLTMSIIAIGQKSDLCFWNDMAVGGQVILLPKTPPNRDNELLINNIEDLCRKRNWEIVCPYEQCIVPILTDKPQ